MNIFTLPVLSSNIGMIQRMNFKQLFNTVAYQSKNVFSPQTFYPIHFNEEGNGQ